MSALTWPHPDAPGICPFQLTVPPGWQPVDVTGALLALLGPEQDGFRSNLIVFGERLPEPVDVAELADAALAHCEPGSLVGPVLEPADQPLPVAVRRATTVAEATRLVQLVAVTTGSDLSPTGLRSAFALVGTCPADRSAQDEPVLADAMASFALAGPAASGEPGELAPAVEVAGAR